MRIGNFDHEIQTFLQPVYIIFVTGTEPGALRCFSRVDSHVLPLPEQPAMQNESSIAQ
jgi:hypothetical protein